jgi:transmembrane sensor
MSNISPADAQIRRYQQAGEWLLRLNGEQSDEAQVTRWLQWCEEDPRNLQAFEQVQGDWNDIVSLRQDTEFAARYAKPSKTRAANSRRYWPLAAAAALAALTVSALWWYPAQQWPRLFSAQHIEASTANKITSLPDGSLLVLRAQAEVKVDYAASERRLDLRKDSEAYFKVRRDPQRPFIVQAGKLTIQAVGTAFDVRRDADRVRVVVEEGSVKVSGANKQWLLTAGQQLEYSSAADHAVTARINADYALRWRDGEFAYEKIALGEVIEDINRYSTRKIQISDDTVLQMPYTGTVFVRSIDDWLRALSSKYPVRVVTVADGVRLEAARPR